MSLSQVLSSVLKSFVQRWTHDLATGLLKPGQENPAREPTRTLRASLASPNIEIEILDSMILIK